MKKSYCFWLCLLASQILAAQSVHPQLAAALQASLDSMHQVLGINGISAAVQLPDDAVWAGGSGVSTFTPLDSITPQHRFETGSSTKTITATCILTLVEEGQLSLDDAIEAWVLGFDHIDPQITIRQLLRHQSGLYDILQNPDFNSSMNQFPNQVWTLEEAIGTFIKAPVFAPGTSWGYSNTNYILLGYIIEQVTGKAFQDVLQERFFQTLGLSSYANPAFDPLPTPAAHLWLDITGDGVLDDAFSYLTSLRSTFSCIGPAGGYFATPSDLARWIRASMSGSLVSSAIWSEAIQTVPTSLPGNTEYGLGLTRRDYIGYEGLGHGGDLGGYTTQAFYFPEKDLSIVVCGNDARIVSWNLSSTIAALLQSYLEGEDLVNATSDLPSSSRMEVFPNPFHDHLQVRFRTPLPSSPLLVQLTTVAGQVVWSEEVTASAGLDSAGYTIEPLADLPAGIYALLVFTEGRLVGWQKVVR